jgi:outer membrane protein assembly complex protein YaeT
VTEVVVEQEGIPITDEVLTSLLETTVGQPLDMREVRETITHLMSLNRYEDVQVFQDATAGGLRLRYMLYPLHPIDRVEYRGSLGLPESDLRQAIAERFGVAVVPGRTMELQQQLQTFYRDRGFIRATVTPRIEPTHQPDRATLIFDIDAGPRSTIASVDVEDVPADERTRLLAESGVRVGEPYDATAIQRALDRFQADLRAAGYYEARTAHFATFDPAGGARLSLSLDRGPHVTVAFAGDPVPEDERDDLVTIKAEASVDEDLLEDSTRAIEDYFKSRGYRYALAMYERSEADTELTITFTVSRGPRYLTSEVKVTGNSAVSTAEVLQALQQKPGAPFVQDAVTAGVTAIRNTYRSRGFTRADIRVNPAVLPPDGSGAADDRRVEVSVDVTEGPRTRVGAITLEGNTVLDDAQIRALMTAAAGRPFSELEIATDRDRIDLEYRNRGYDSVVVEPRVMFAEADTRADVRFVISEGPQVFVDQVIVLGNRRTSMQTITRELTVRPGEPLSYAALIESQQRLGALGLFRRIQITSLAHQGEPRRDVLVQLEEAPPTTLDYGGGVEGRTLLRSSDEGQAQERFEFAPRGFIQISRRNLFGKNRAVTLFGRVSLRSRDAVFDDNGVRFPTPQGSYGFNEYRVYGTYREPRVFNSGGDVLLTGIVEQASRSSFNFRTREARAELGGRIRSAYSVVGRYSFEHTTLFDEQFDEDEKPLIDKLFPQVQLSKIAGSLIRDTRDDVLYPNKGTFSVIDGEVAARALGSEVGFVKTFIQTFAYVPLKTQRRIILAMGARLGAAHGFALETAGAASDEAVLLPASERFFAGGDTTVRGFSLDRLGDEQTISTSGFPTGGNGEVVLQSELRVSIMRNRAEVVGFVDAGNIFRRASDVDLTNLRPAAGFGGRYRSPVGPIRVDLGFNLDRRELVPGTLERGYVLHISLGQAF